MLFTALKVSPPQEYGSFVRLRRGTPPGDSCPEDYDADYRTSRGTRPKLAWGSPKARSSSAPGGTESRWPEGPGDPFGSPRLEMAEWPFRPEGAEELIASGAGPEPEEHP